MSCGVGHRRSSDLTWLWLWLWCRPAAAALTPPLAWELPYVVAGVALKSQKKNGFGVLRVPQLDQCAGMSLLPILLHIKELTEIIIVLRPLARAF